MDNELLIQQCKSLVPLGTMRIEHLRTALESAEYLTACKDDILFSKDDPLDPIFYLLSGEIKLTHQSGRERIITADFHWLPIVQFQTEQFSATALTDCELIKFDRKNLDNLLTWSQVADYLDLDISYNRDLDEDAEWITTILKSNLFYKIPPLNVLSIYGKVLPKNVSAGEVILEQGAKGEYCYFIKEGLAEVIQSENGESQPVAEIGIGRCFGEDALINNAPRNATVKMLTEGTLMCLHKSDFEELLQEPVVGHIPEVTVDSLSETSFEFLDVRTQEEYDYRHIEGSLHIPLTLLRLKIRTLNPDTQYVVYCNTGTRSRATAFLLADKGYKVSLLEGGLANLKPEHVQTMMASEYDDIHRLASQ